MGQTIGIDFGTTNTVVSCIGRNGKPLSMRLQNNDIILPTAVFYSKEEEYIIGQSAINRGKVYRSGLAVSFKTDIASQERRVIKCANGDIKKILPHKIAADFFKKLIDLTTEWLSRKFGTADAIISKVVITVPAKFNPTQKEIIKRAAQKSCGCDVFLACEPTAAAAADYESEDNESKTLVVYDFGGGTFDVSAIRADKTGEYIDYTELDTNGDPELGGNLITFNIAKDIIRKLGKRFDVSDLEFDPDKSGKYPVYDRDNYSGTLDYDLEYLKSMHTIIDTAEKCKLECAESESFEEMIFLYLPEETEANISYTYPEIKKLIEPSIDRTIQITKSLIDGLNEQGIKTDAIVLAGGSSNIPMVCQKLNETFSIPLRTGENYDTLISCGAVVLSDIDELHITQVTNCEYGIIENQGPVKGVFKPLIPCHVKLPFTTEYKAYPSSGAHNIDVLIYQRDIQNYPDSQNLMQPGLTMVDRFSVALPQNINSENCDMNLSLTLKTDGSFEASVSVYENGDLIKDQVFEINRLGNME